MGLSDYLNLNQADQSRNSPSGVFLGKVLWKYVVNLQENTHAEVKSNFIEITLLAWVFSCKFAEYFPNTFS